MRSPSPGALALLVSLVLVVWVIAWLALAPSDAASTSNSETRVEPQKSTMAERTPSEDIQLGAIEAVQESASRVEVASPPEVVPAEVTTESLVKEVAILTGSIVLVGDGGVRRSDLTGELRVIIWGEEGGRSVTTDVLDGSFELRVKLSEDGQVSLIDSDDPLDVDLESLQCQPRLFNADELQVLLFCDPVDTRILSSMPRFDVGATDVELAVCLAPSLTLNVLDAATGNHLDDVEVIACTSSRDQRRVHPRGLRTAELVTAGVSPLVVHPSKEVAGRKTAGLLVRAEGSAWKGVTVDFSVTGERTIELIPAGELKVVIEGDIVRGAMLRLRSEGQGPPLAEFRLGKQHEVHLESLAPAEYSVTVQLGKWYSEPITIGSATVDVQPGGTASATIKLEALDPVTTADISGTLYVPTEWGYERHSLRLELLGSSKRGGKRNIYLRGGELKAVNGEPGEFTFQKSDLETGEYALSFGELDYKLVFELPPEGRNDLRLQVPEPVEITVAIVAVDTGIPVEDIDTVHWHPSWPASSRGGRLQSTKRDETSGRFHLWVPKGPIEVSSPGGDYEGNLHISDATHGLEVTLEVQIRTSAFVELRSGDQNVPWPADYGWQVEHVDGIGHYNGSGSGNGKRWFGVSEPGRYRLVIPEIDGFLPHDPVEVNLVAGKREHVVIELIAR